MLDPNRNIASNLIEAMSIEGPRDGFEIAGASDPASIGHRAAQRVLETRLTRTIRRSAIDGSQSRGEAYRCRWWSCSPGISAPLLASKMSSPGSGKSCLPISTIRPFRKRTSRICPATSALRTNISAASNMRASSGSGPLGLAPFRGSAAHEAVRPERRDLRP
jgi:hypothetical protein